MTCLTANTSTTDEESQGQHFPDIPVNKHEVQDRLSRSDHNNMTIRRESMPPLPLWEPSFLKPSTYKDQPVDSQHKGVSNTPSGLKRILTKALVDVGVTGDDCLQKAATITTSLAELYMVCALIIVIGCLAHTMLGYLDEWIGISYESLTWSARSSLCLFFWHGSGHRSGFVCVERRTSNHRSFNREKMKKEIGSSHLLVDRD